MGDSGQHSIPVLENDTEYALPLDDEGRRKRIPPRRDERDWFDRLFPLSFGYIALMLVTCLAVFIWAVRFPALKGAQPIPTSIVAHSSDADKADVAVVPVGRSAIDAPTPSPMVPPTATPVAAASPPVAAVSTVTVVIPTLAASPPPSARSSPPPVATSSVVLSQGAIAFAQGDARGLASDPAGALSLVPTLGDNFDAPTLDASQWRVVPWGAGGTVQTREGTATIDVAALRSQRPFVHRTLTARVRFTGGVFQNLAWSADLNGPTAILIGVPAADPAHLYARVKHEGEADRLVQLPVSLADGEYHVYQVAWQANQIDFAVDGAVRATIQVALDAPMFAWLSSASAQSLAADWIWIDDYSSTAGTFTSQPIEASQSLIWHTLRVRGALLDGTRVQPSTRTSMDGVIWSQFASVADDGKIASPPGRYLQYRIVVDGTAMSSPTINAVFVTGSPP
jgi:hypothetical protein